MKYLFKLFIDKEENENQLSAEDIDNVSGGAKEPYSQKGRN
jgi:hypothetical protein